MADTVFVSAVAALTLVASACDLRTQKLPNWLTVPGLLAAFAFHGVISGGPGLLAAVGGCATGFGIMLILWLTGGGGAGDVKFMAMLGGWLGATTTLYVFLLSIFFVLVYMTSIRVAGLVKHEARTLGKNAGRRLKATGHLVPYALPVTLGTWIVLASKLFGPLGS